MDVQHTAHARERGTGSEVISMLSCCLPISALTGTLRLSRFVLIYYFVLSFPFSSRFNAEIEEPRRERSGKGKGKGNAEEQWLASRISERPG